MVADAGDQFDRVRQLDQVIVGAEPEGVALHHGVLSAGQHHDGDAGGRGIGAKLAHQVQAADIGHDEVLQDDGRPEVASDGQRLLGIGAVVELGVGLRQQDAPDRLADHGLIVDQQHPNGQGGRGGQPVVMGISRRHGASPVIVMEKTSASLEAIRFSGKISTAASAIAAAFGIP